MKCAQVGENGIGSSGKADYFVCCLVPILFVIVFHFELDEDLVYYLSLRSPSMDGLRID